MKLTKAGAVATVDEKRRIALPDGLCKELGIYPKDQFEFLVADGRIFMARHTPTCLICDDDCDVKKVNKTFLCGECRKILWEHQGFARLFNKDNFPNIGENLPNGDFKDGLKLV